MSITPEIKALVDRLNQELGEIEQETKIRSKNLLNRLRDLS